MSNNKTKLIATYGPSLHRYFSEALNDHSDNEQIQLQQFKKMITFGVDVIRINLSHNSLIENIELVHFLKKLSSKTNYPLGILFDTKGPEIRVDSIQTVDNEQNQILKNDIVEIHCLKENFIGNGKSFSISDISKKYNLIQDLNVDDIILIDDGNLVLKVQSLNVDQNIIYAESLSEKYTIKTNKRINVPNKKYSLPFLSSFDIECIKEAVKHNVDFLALSFVNNVDNITQVRKIINDVNPNSQIKIICKIESFEATQNLESLVINSDGIMVARGDLALEIGYEKIPLIQDQIVNLCHKHNKISIIATQMLDSLETKLLPTRSEVTDCFYAVKQLASATMLSSETAAGHDPMNAIKTMKKITNYSEEHLSNIENANFAPLLYFNKDQKKLVKKYLYKISENTNILLKKFTEKDIRVLIAWFPHKNFLIDSSDYEQASKFALYRNLNYFTDKIDSFTIVTKKE